MSLTITLSPRSQAALERCQEALELYGRYTKRTPAKFLSAAVSKLLLGEDDESGAHTAGLFDRLRATAPAAGSITEAARARRWRMGRRSSTSLSMARDRANELLGEGESAAFKVLGSKHGSKLVLGTMYKQTKARVASGRTVRFSNRRGSLKNPVDAVGVSRRAARASGGALLNRQALIVSIALRRREAARYSVAAQFLPSRYRTTIRRLAGITYRGNQAVGLAGGSADSSRYHVRDTQLIANAKGRTLGSLEYAVQPGSATATVIGELGVYTAAQDAAIADSLNVVADHALRRVLARLGDNAADFHRFMQLNQPA